MSSSSTPNRALGGARALRAAAGLAAVGALFLSGCGVLGGGTEPNRDESGSVTEAVDDADVFAIKVGDCLNDSSSTGEVSAVPITPCGDAHDSEAFHAFDLTGDTYPGDEAIQTEAAKCQDEFAAYVGKAYEESTLEINYYSPTEQSWKDLDDREILCLVYDPAGKTTGSLKGSAK